MERKELIELVERIMDPVGKTEREIDDLIEILKKNVPHPEVTNLIYYQENTAEELIDKALSYKVHLLPPSTNNLPS